jgi:hypothetical protein
MFSKDNERRVIATKWQNMNNPVQSAGLKNISQQNPERVQSPIIEPFQGSKSLLHLSSGFTGGYSNSSPLVLTKRY